MTIQKEVYWKELLFILYVLKLTWIMFYVMTCIFTKMSSFTSISINRNEFLFGNLERALMQLLSHLIQQLKKPISHFHLNIRIITSIQFSSIIWITRLAALPCGAQTKKKSKFAWRVYLSSLVLKWFVIISVTSIEATITLA